MVDKLQRKNTGVHRVIVKLKSRQVDEPAGSFCVFLAIRQMARS
ncbi:MAG: hypothetical protein AB8G77_14215 [Rhodothermales bacterium]